MLSLRAAVNGVKAATRSHGLKSQRRFMSHGDVKKHPDLERWNNVRDNIDQTFDIEKPRTFLGCLVFGVLIPYTIYKAIAKEGLIRNGDSSTGVTSNLNLKE